MKKTLLAVAVAAFGLSACSTLDGKAPHEMVGISVDRSLSKDYSYNFESKAYTFLSDKDKGVAPQVAAEAEKKREKESAEKAEAVGNADTAGEAKAESSEQAEYEEYNPYSKVEEGNWGGKAADLAQEYPAITKYIQNMQLRMNGAVDLRQQKIELIPEFINNNKNEYSSMKMPILLDGKNMTATIDMPATVPTIMSIFIKDKGLVERLTEQPIKFAWSDVEKKNIPLKTTLKALVKASYTAYKAVPPEAYKAAEMDQFGKRAGAKHRVDIVWNKENLEAFYQAFYRDFDHEFTRMQKAGLEEGVSEESYQTVRSVVAQIFGVKLEDTGSALENEMAEVVETASAMKASAETVEAADTVDDYGVSNLVNDMEAFEKMVGSPMVESIYLDGKGRTVARRSYLQANGKEKALNFEIAITLNRFGNPVFTFKPDNSKTVKFPEVMKAFRLPSGSDSYNAAGDHEVDESIEAPENPNEIKEEVVK